MKQPGQTVTEVALRIGIATTLASRHLRDLNARGLLKASRENRWVRYRPCADPTVPQAPRLVQALRETFARQPKPIDFIFRMATAFTHPRRVQIVRALAAGPLDCGDLRSVTSISLPAIMRHLRKLRDRGFVATDPAGRYGLVRQESPLGVDLLRLAGPSTS